LAIGSAFIRLCVAIGMLLLPSTMTWSQEVHEHPLSYWIDRLENGSLAEKRRAAIVMVSLEPKDERVVDLLILALQQKQSYELQSLAANALASLGPFAEKAVPALVDALAGPDIEDNSVREQAASALSRITSETPLRLTIALEEADNKTVIVGLPERPFEKRPIHRAGEFHLRMA
jgi:HEAT repeat protein